MTTMVLPPIRACLFDLDGLLLNTEDIYTDCINQVSAAHHGTSIPTPLRATIAGQRGGFECESFLKWARKAVPCSLKVFLDEVNTLMRKRRAECAFLPGAEAMLRSLTRSARVRRVLGGEEVVEPVVVAVVSSTTREKFEQKVRRHAAVFDLIPPALKMCGDDANIPSHVRPKPAPDRYLLALEMINERNGARKSACAPDLIRAEECLVFEDSIVGVEAARKAGMRVIWVPNGGVRDAVKEWEEEILQGTFSMRGETTAASEGHLAECRDIEGVNKWALASDSLVGFDFSSYGIILSPKT